MGHDAGRHLDVARLRRGDIDRRPAARAPCRLPVTSFSACVLLPERAPPSTRRDRRQREGRMCSIRAGRATSQQAPASLTPSAVAWGFSASAIAALALAICSGAASLKARASGPKSPMRCSTSGTSLPWFSIWSTGSIDRPAKPGLGQDALDPRAIAEGILAGILRPRPLDRRQERLGRAHRHRAPRDSPAGVRQQRKTSRPAGFSARRIFWKAATGSPKNITPKREKTRSNDAGLERMGRGIAHLEGRIGEPLRARRLDQRLGDVDAQHMAVGADRLGELGRRAAGAAADIEHLLAGLRAGGREGDLAEARDAALDAVVGAQPHLAAGALPVGRLLGGELAAWSSCLAARRARPRSARGM